MADVVVLGSANMDLVVEAPRAPRAGETVTGTSFEVVPGGKGLNQAVAAARADVDVDVAFVGSVGTDAHGEAVLKTLRDAGVDTRFVRELDVRTGTAHITVSTDGENRIVVVPGANGAVTELRDDQATALMDTHYLLTQLEIPLSLVELGLALARSGGATTVLTPAPAVSLSESILSLVDIIVPNQHELQTLTGQSDPKRGARRLRDLGADTVVVTLGADGAIILDDAGLRHVPALPAEPVDTTGAGDVFVGFLTANRQRGRGWSDALGLAAAAAACSVERAGAVASIPLASVVQARLEDHQRFMSGGTRPTDSVARFHP